MAEIAPADTGPAANKESSGGGPSSSEGGAGSRSPRRHARSKKRTYILVIIVGLALIIIGFFLWRYFNSYESTDDAQVDAHLYPVSARISGYVMSVNVNDNQYVQQGTLLVEIDPKDYEVAVAQAQANLDSAEATARSLNVNVPITTVNTASQLTSATSDVASSDAGVIAAENQVTAARAQLDQAEADNVKAQDDLRRYKALVDKQEVAEQVYDQAVAAAKAGTASVAAAKANEAAAEQMVQQAKSHLTGSEAARKSAETAPQQISSIRDRARAALADVEQKRAALEQAQLNLQYTKILAPVTGEVNKTVVVGMNVQPGQQLLTVVPLDDVWITANFKETQLKRMRIGDRAEIHVDANGRTYRGHVDSIAGATGPIFSLLPPENATGNYVKIVQRIPVKIVLDPGQNSDLQLRPGMNVEPDVYLQ